jgi:hypothetical protein
MSLQDWAADIVPEGMESLFPKGSRIVGERRRPVTAKHMAPGYRTIATIYTCIPDVAHPWDPNVVRAIWRFAPNFVPMWERRVLLPQGALGDEDAIITGRHALGRVLKNQRGWLPELKVTMPSFPCQGLTFERPNDLAFVHEDVLEEGQSRDLPGPYLPFDGTIVRKAVDLAIGYSMSEKEYKEFLNATIVEASFRDYLRRMQGVEDDMEARDREFQPWAARQVERISDVEMGQYMRSAGRRERPRKPFVVVP